MTSFAVHTKPRYRVDDKEKGALCKLCNRIGHNADTCYAVIGYPEWWGDRPKGRTLQAEVAVERARVEEEAKDK